MESLTGVLRTSRADLVRCILELKTELNLSMIDRAFERDIDTLSRRSKISSAYNEMT